MKIANGIEMLEVPANIMGTPDIIYPTLLWDKNTVILVDTGFPGQLANVREAVEQAGVAFDRLDLVIITHHDIDHIGGAASIQKELPGQVKILAYSDEKAYIQGDKRPLKLVQLETNLNALPEQMRAVYDKLNTAFQNSRVPVNQTLADGEELPYLGGITVLFTPGHTLGHICLYLQHSKTLIAGDALAVEAGVLVKTADRTNYDLDLYKKSLQKLTNYDIATIICYHGGLYRDNPNQRIAALAAE